MNRSHLLLLRELILAAIIRAVTVSYIKPVESNEVIDLREVVSRESVTSGLCTGVSSEPRNPDPARIIRLS